MYKNIDPPQSYGSLKLFGSNRRTVYSQERLLNLWRMKSGKITKSRSLT